MVETLSEKHTCQLIVGVPFPLWISVSKNLISENYTCLISIISPLKIQTSTMNKTPNYYKRNKKEGDEPSAKKTLLWNEFIHRRIYCNMVDYDFHLKHCLCVRVHWEVYNWVSY